VERNRAAASRSVTKGDAVILVIDGIYIVLGLAIVAMAFNLIQVCVGPGTKTISKI